MDVTGPAPRAAGPTIGIVGPFDSDDLGAVISGRVLRHELARRLPEADIRVLAPFGWERPHRLHAGVPAEALGPWSEDRASAVADELTAIVLVEGDAGDPERDRWLDGAGWPDDLAVESAPSAPPLAVLAGTLVAPEVVTKRLEFLRLMGWWPPADAGDVTVVESAGGLQVRAAGSVFDLPPELSVEDVLTVVGSATSVEATSDTLVAICDAYAPAASAVRAEAELWLDGLAERIGKQATAKAEDRARATAERVRELDRRLHALQMAYDAQSRRLVDERAVFADHVDALAREFGVTRAEVVAAQEAAAAARAEAQAAEAEARHWETVAASHGEARVAAEALRQAAEAELDAMKRSRSWRLTRPLRAVGRRLRGRG